jgi:hypothetical protein
MSHELPPPQRGNTMFTTGAPAPTRDVNSSMQVSGATPLVFILTPIAYRLLAPARQLAIGGEHQFAVVLSQAACGLHTQEVLGNLMSRRGAGFLSDAVISLAGNTISLGNEKVRSIYEALTSDYPAGSKQPHQDARGAKRLVADHWQSPIIYQPAFHTLHLTARRDQDPPAAASLRGKDVSISLSKEDR